MIAKMMSTRLIFFIFCLISIVSLSQPITPSWQKSVSIYSDNDIKLKICMKIDSSNCGYQTNAISEYKFKLAEKSDNFNDKYITFSFDYVNCNNQIITKIISVDVSQNSSGEEIESQDFQIRLKRLFSIDPKAPSYFYDARRSNSPINSESKKYPSDPKSITGNAQIILGEKTTLTVDGEDLIEPSKWVWHKESCDGEKVGEGKRITISPNESTTYFVRAENKSLEFNSKCKQITVRVNAKSFEAEQIIGNKIICQGKSTNLELKGGKLGKGAKWVWYSSNDFSEKSKISEGNSCLVFPKIKTVYYVRAEGDENITTPVSFEVDIAENSVKPDKIRTVSEKICVDEIANFSVEGGNLGTNSKWVWYDENDKMLTNGSTANVRIKLGAQLIKVRAEGLCNNTDYTTVSIEGLSNSKIFGISENKFDEKYNKLTVSGYLGDKAQWVWYVNSKKNPSEFNDIKGKGTEIKVPIKKTRVYKIIAEGGLCDNKSDISSFHSIEAYKKTKLKRKLDIVYYREDFNDARKKNFHLGFGVGIYNQYNSVSLLDNQINNSKLFSVDSANKFKIITNGLSWDITFTPFIFEEHKNQSNNKFSASLSFYHKGGVATFDKLANSEIGNNIIQSNISDTIGKIDKVVFNKSMYNCQGVEIVLGFRGFRFYYSYENELNSLSLTAQFQKYQQILPIYSKPENFNFNEELSLQKNKYGFRFGRYASKNKLGHNRGLTYDIYAMSVNRVSNDPTLINHFPAYGIGFSLWAQTMMKVNAEVIAFSNSNVLTSLKLNLNLDLFY